MVLGVWRRDVDDVDGGIRDEVGIRAVCRGDAELGGERLCALQAARATAWSCWLAWPQRRGERACDATGSDDPPAQGRRGRGVGCAWFGKGGGHRPILPVD